jgi:hypothetical protein
MNELRRGLTVLWVAASVFFFVGGLPLAGVGFAIGAPGWTVNEWSPYLGSVVGRLFGWCGAWWI